MEAEELQNALNQPPDGAAGAAATAVEDSGAGGLADRSTLETAEANGGFRCWAIARANPSPPTSAITFVGENNYRTAARRALASGAPISTTARNSTSF